MAPRRCWASIKSELHETLQQQKVRTKNTEIVEKKAVHLFKTVLVTFPLARTYSIFHVYGSFPFEPMYNIYLGVSRML